MAHADEPTPNSGASLEAVKAVGPDHESISEWRRKNGINPAEQVKIVRLSHMRYQHSELDKITTFLKDFGMSVVKQTDDKVWWAGYGQDPYVYVIEKGPENKYLGGVFLVESEADLEKVLKIPGAIPKIESLDDAPGGGKRVTLIDPEGFPVSFMYGQEPVPQRKPFDTISYNTENVKPRMNKFQRFKKGPAAVHKLGHFGLCVQNFKGQADFYTKHFNIVPTDWLYVEHEGAKRDVALFAHIDRGQDFVDHHTFFLSTNPTSHVHHCSFEVHDIDTQLLGHQWLAEKKYNSVWGVGRHILGSQIFDYWWDTTGFMVEHYCDGDLVNEETPIGRLAAGDESLAVWGPDVPPTFLQ